MNFRLRPLALIAPLALALAAACTSPEDVEDVDGADSNLDYRSTVGREFDIAASATIELSDSRPSPHGKRARR